MPTQNTVLTTFMVPLLAVLYGCQQGEPPQQPGTPASAVPVAQQPAANNTAAISRAEFLKLAKEIGCLSCHSIDKKLLGPSWKNVAAINLGDPAAETRLMDKIAKGGGGVWGNIAMPAYPDLSKEKNRTLVRFILTLE